MECHCKRCHCKRGRLYYLCTAKLLAWCSRRRSTIISLACSRDVQMTRGGGEGASVTLTHCTFRCLWPRPPPPPVCGWLHGCSGVIHHSLPLSLSLSLLISPILTPKKDTSDIKAFLLSLMICFQRGSRTAFKDRSFVRSTNFMNDFSNGVTLFRAA